jgi:hypothetical protein
MNKVLCSISTRGRYDTTLPLAILSVIQQTIKPNKLMIFDDNLQPKDLREQQHYLYLFKLLDQHNIKWECVFAARKGQHHNHQMANLMGYEWVWRLDDDTVAEPNVLETLLSHTAPDVGAVAGSIITPPDSRTVDATGKIDRISQEPNPQWGMIKKIMSVDHLHCSFLYRAGIYDYNLSLSAVAHREETLFTWGLKQKGYTLLLVPNAITWHLKNDQGGIRVRDDPAPYDHDQKIFDNFIKYKDHTIVVLDCGMGDHIVFKHVLPKIANPLVFSCYPDIIPGDSIAQAKQLFGDISHWNIYQKMDQWKWTQSLQLAFEKLYIPQGNHT